MLSNRKYMRNYQDNAVSGKKTLMMLIVINVICFLIIPQDKPLYLQLALSAPGIKSMMLWQPLTYMFLHGGFGHILFNMYGLYIFGTLVAEELGRERFLALYLSSGVCGGMLWLAANWESPIPVVGASGALFGVMMAMAMLNPNREYMLLFFPTPIKCKTLIIVYALLEVFSELSGGGNIAHLAHLGGFFSAYFFIRFVCPRLVVWDPLEKLFGNAASKGWKVHNPSPRQENFNPKDLNAKAYRQNATISRQEIDRLLDKIASQGINSLTAEETAALKLARDQMKKS